MDKRIGDTERRGIGRRTVVRAAVVTAWTAPLVQVVAAPAFAACSGPANLSTSTGTVTRSTSNNKVLDVAAQVSNSGGQETSSLGATVEWLADKTNGSSAIVSVAMPAGWTGSGTSFTTSSRIAACATLPVNLTVTLDKANAKGKLTVTFSASGTTGPVSGAV